MRRVIYGDFADSIDSKVVAASGPASRHVVSSAGGADRPPTIAPLPAGPARPFWSVMIPIYNCREDYLRETLRSVLGQDPGVADMQIEVIDNDSTIGDPEAVIREMGSERIEYHRQPINVGIILQEAGRIDVRLSPHATQDVLFESNLLDHAALGCSPPLFSVPYSG